jgi:tetratricopeptide (TPR) repeat protein
MGARLCGLALFYRPENLHDSQDDSFQRALAQYPEFADAHFNRAIISARSKNLPAARTGFERTLAIDPEHTEATFNLGNVMLQLNDRPRALSLYRHTLELSPGHTGAKAMLERLLPAGK